MEVDAPQPPPPNPSPPSTHLEAPQTAVPPHPSQQQSDMPQLPGIAAVEGRMSDAAPSPLPWHPPPNRGPMTPNGHPDPPSDQRTPGPLASPEIQGNPVPPAPEQSETPSPSGAYRPLNVKDALSYLEMVKVKFSDRPDVYNQFLDIMKDFKSQA